MQPKFYISVIVGVGKSLGKNYPFLKALDGSQTLYL
jgi:hypothetical protein